MGDTGDEITASKFPATAPACTGLTAPDQPLAYQSARGTRSSVPAKVAVPVTLRTSEAPEASNSACKVPLAVCA